MKSILLKVTQHHRLLLGLRTGAQRRAVCYVDVLTEAKLVPIQDPLPGELSAALLSK